MSISDAQQSATRWLSRVVTVQDGGTPRVKDLSFHYTHNRSPWIMIWGEWGVDGNGEYDPNDPNSVYTMTAGREFRFNGASRWVSRDFDPSTAYFDFVGDALWTDAAGDFNVLPLDPNDPNYPGYSATMQRTYPGGFAQHEVAADESRYCQRSPKTGH